MDIGFADHETRNTRHGAEFRPPAEGILPARPEKSNALIHASITGPLPEQCAMAGVLSDMDAELLVLEKRREKTRQLKQGMMQELLTGRTRLI